MRSRHISPLLVKQINKKRESQKKKVTEIVAFFKKWKSSLYILQGIKSLNQNTTHKESTVRLNT